MRRFALVLVMLPLGALAAPMSRTDDNGASDGRSSPRYDQERLRLTRSLGLALALDLDVAQARAMRDRMTNFDQRCQELRRRHLEASRHLRRVASGEHATAAQADEAIGDLLDLEAQIQQVHREMLRDISKDLSAQNRARAAVLLAGFRDRFGISADTRATAARRKIR